MATVLLVAVILLGALPVRGTGGTTPIAPAARPTLTGTVSVGAFSQAALIPSAFWGVNVAAAQRFNDTDAISVAATPVTYLRFPGGNLAEEYNYTTAILTADDGTQSRASTSTQMFVTACKLIQCHAILELPAEINQPATAAYYASYVVHTLNFQPTYWEIGNDPSGWKHYNTPWSAWGSSQGGNTTPLPFANLVHSYIGAVLSVDPAAKFLALGAGMGGKGYSKPWVEDLAIVDGQVLSGISVHSYIEGGPLNPTDAELFTNLNGKYSLPAQVSADRSYIQAACPSCSNLNLFVTEINVAESGSFATLLSSFAGTLYLAAETTQGLANQVANLDWFAYDSHYGGSWSTGPQKWQSQYYLFRNLLTHLENETLPTQVTGPSTFYGVATFNGSAVALLLVNVNQTSSVQLNLSAAGFSPSAPLTQYLWLNGTPLPVESQLPAGGFGALPPMSTEVLVGSAFSPPTFFPVVFTESGLPSGTHWSVTLNGTTHSTTSATIDFSELNDTYPFSVPSTPGYNATPVNGSVTVSGAPASIPIAFASQSTPEFPVTFLETGLPAGTLWALALNGSALAATTNSIGFWEINGSYPFIVGGVEGFTPTPDAGSIVLDGRAVNVSLTYTPTTVTYPATFSETGLESGLWWNVSVGGSTAGAQAPDPIVVGLSNGTFAFSVAPAAGYSTTPSTGWVTIEDAGTTAAVTFVLIPPSTPNHIATVEGGVTSSNGSAIPGVGLTLIFRGGATPVEWLNLTADSTGRFTVTGLNLTGNLTAVNVDSPGYMVTLTNVAWRASDAVVVTVVLEPVSGHLPPGATGFPFGALLGLPGLIIALAGAASVLWVGVFRAVNRGRRMARYRKYFANPPR